MSQLELIIYNSLSMPIDLCNIITSYYVDHIIKVIDCYNKVFYKCKDMKVRSLSTIIGLYDYKPCIYDMTYASQYVFIYDILTSRCLKVLNFKEAVHSIEYSNGLVCQHFDTISKYKIDQEPIMQSSITACSILHRLEYADCNYIIIMRSLEFLDIYSTNLKLIHSIKCPDKHTVSRVAMINNALSYSAFGKWHLIKL